MVAPQVTIELNDLIQETRLFRNLDLAELSAVAALGEYRWFGAGEQLGSAGELASALYIIVEGMASMPSITGTGAVLLLSRSDVYGISGMVEPHHYLVTATADTDCHVFAIPTMGLHALTDTNDSLGRRLFQEIARHAYERFVEAIKDARGYSTGNYVDGAEGARRDPVTTAAAPQ